MTKRSPNTDSSAPRSIIATLLTAIILIVAVAVGSLTGVDVLDMLGLSTPVATTPAPTATLAATRAPTTAATAAPPIAVSPVLTQVASLPNGVVQFTLPQGFGAQKSFWQVFFTAPTGSRDAKTYVNGIETQLAIAINQLRRNDTLDIAAFEFNLPLLTQVVLDAHKRGVKIRMVTDTQHGLDDDDATVQQLVQAGIPVVGDIRTAFMHNKFMILNRTSVWTGSWNFTINDTYRNNNNAVVLRSQRVVERYQAEFDQMFDQKVFGPRKSASVANPFSQDGVPIEIYFSPKDEPLQAIIRTISGAKKSIRFLTFSFTDFDVASAIMNRASANKSIRVQGIFETTGSETQASELRTLLCAGLDVRQDGNPFVLHHKVFIVDDTTVITGSFNISTNATQSNDENLLIISDVDLAAQYVAEFNRRWAEARVPTRITCQ